MIFGIGLVGFGARGPVTQVLVVEREPPQIRHARDEQDAVERFRRAHAFWLNSYFLLSWMLQLLHRCSRLPE